MLAAFKVSASLYSTSIDYEQQNNIVLSDEAVAAYFKKKFEAEDIKPAVVMEYLVKLMGSKKKGGDETSECLSSNLMCALNILLRLNIIHEIELYKS